MIEVSLSVIVIIILTSLLAGTILGVSLTRPTK